jgi:hypothetical protein
VSTHFVYVIASILFFVPGLPAAQGYIEIEIGNLQLSRSLAGIAHDQHGLPVEGVLVEELGSGWKDPLRSTKTDAAGAFAFSPVKGREIYYFQLRKDGFDPLRVRVKIDRRRGKSLKLQMSVAN